MKKGLGIIFVFAIVFLCNQTSWARLANVDYHDLFFETRDEAQSEGLACTSQPNQGSHITCGWNYYEPLFWLGMGCYTGYTGDQLQVNCYYGALYPPYDIDFGQTCEDNEAGMCPLDLNSDISPKCPMLGNPINIINGNNYETEADMRIPTAHYNGFEFKRSYNSRSDVETPMGYGWRHNWDVTLSRADDITSFFIRIIDQTGRRFFYYDPYHTNNYAGFWRAPNNVTGTWEDGWVWTRSGSVYTFNTLGKLVSLEDNQGNVQTLTYNDDNQLISVYDDASDRTLTFQYNTNGNLESVTGPATAAVPDGIWARYEYDGDNNLTRVIYADDDNGSTASGFEYRYEDPNDVNNMTAKLNLAQETISTWQYDNSDRAWQNDNREGKGVTIDYNQGYDEIGVTDAYGVTATYTLASLKGQKYIQSITGENGCSSCGANAVRWEYDSSGRIVEKEYANGRIDRFEGYDGYWYEYPPQKIIDFNGSQQRMINRTYHNWYSKLPEVVEQTESSLIGQGDKITLYDFDSDGNDIANESPTLKIYRIVESGYTIDSSAAVVAYEYITVLERNAKGQVTSVNGPRLGDQDKITYTYQTGTDNLSSIAYPHAGTVYFDQYDAVGNLLQMTDLNGVVTTFAYDGRNRLLSFTRNGVTTSLTYTAAGNPDISTDAVGRVLDFQYNPAGFLEKIVDPTGNYVFFDYNATGDIIEQALFSSDGTQTGYLGLDYGDPVSNTDLVSGRPWKLIRRNQTDTADLETVLEYDVSGNLDAVTDAAGKDTIFKYDKLNNLQCIEKPGQVITEFEYDRHGNLISVTDPEGLVTHYLYDDMDRLVRTDSPDTGIIIYVYDAAGNVKTENRNGQIVEYAYDDLNRLTHIIYEDTTKNVTLTYDNGPGASLKGRLASVTDAGGTIQYSYDDNGFLATETRTVAGITYVTDYDFDAAGNLNSMVYPTDQIVEYQPDSVDVGSLAAVNIDLGSGFQALTEQLAYKPFGPLANLTYGNGLQLSNTYDKSYQLATSSAGAILDRTYTPDNVGNIVSITDNQDALRTQSFGYDDIYRLTNASGIYGDLDFTYDKTGNRLSRTQNSAQDTYQYISGTNQLHMVYGPNSELFSYDIDGNVVSRATGASNPRPPVTNPPDYVYNSYGQRVSKTVDSQTTVYHYDIAGQLIAETDASGNLIKAYVWLYGQPLAMIDADSSIYYYHNDHLGTPQKMTDAAGTVVWAADYLPFGQADVTVETVVNNLRFAGQYYDSETGLHYNYHRYYDPKLGRYLRADPIGLEGGANLYAYVQNDPVNYIDPTGEFAFLIPAIIWGVEYTAGMALADLTIAAALGYTANQALQAAQDSDNGDACSGGTIYVDPQGNAIPTPPGGGITGSPDGDYIQGRDANGNPTGIRKDGGHNPAGHPDPRAQQPHGHVPGVTNPDGTPWLPVK